MHPEPTRVLVVDDDVDTCRNLADILDDVGYRADTAHDGPAALAMVRQRPYRVTVLDYRMPGMDGLTVCREIHKMHSGTVSIIVTAYAGQTSVEQFLDAGASCVLAKPVDVSLLLETLGRLCEDPGPEGNPG